MPYKQKKLKKKKCIKLMFLDGLSRVQFSGREIYVTV
jgi:hypothetical protein